jgi:hypothetical protein
MRQQGKEAAGEYQKFRRTQASGTRLIKNERIKNGTQLRKKNEPKRQKGLRQRFMMLINDTGGQHNG